MLNFVLVSVSFSPNILVTCVWSPSVVICILWHLSPLFEDSDNREFLLGTAQRPVVWSKWTFEIRCGALFARGMGIVASFGDGTRMGRRSEVIGIVNKICKAFLFLLFFLQGSFLSSWIKTIGVVLLVAHQYPWQIGDPDTDQEALRYFRSETGRHEDARRVCLWWPE